jgi:hypothetical protein
MKKDSIQQAEKLNIRNCRSPYGIRENTRKKRDKKKRKREERVNEMLRKIEKK